MKDLQFYHKKRNYDDSPLGRLDEALTKLYDRADETLGWKFSYKGNKYGHVIYGTEEYPINDESVAMMLESAARLMRKLINKGEKK